VLSTASRHETLQTLRRVRFKRVLRFVPEVHRAGWVLQFGDTRLRLESSDLPPHDVIANALRSCLSKLSWSRFEERIPLSKESRCSLRITGRLNQLTMSLWDELGQSILSKPVTSLTELVTAFRPLLIDDDQFVIMRRYADLLSLHPPPEAPTLPTATASPTAPVRPWPAIVTEATFHVAYHPEWEHPRAQDTPVQIAADYICVASKQGPVLLDILAGTPITMFPGHLNPRCLPAGLALTEDLRVLRYRPDGHPLWSHRLQRLEYPAGALKHDESWLIWNTDGATISLSDTGQPRWELVPTTGEDPMLFVTAEHLWVTDCSGLVSCYQYDTGTLITRTRLRGVPVSWEVRNERIFIVLSHPPELGFSLVCLDATLRVSWARHFTSALVGAPLWRGSSTVVLTESDGHTVLHEIKNIGGEMTQHQLELDDRPAVLKLLGTRLVIITNGGGLFTASMNELQEWTTIRESRQHNGGLLSVTDRGDFWILAGETLDIIMPESGLNLGTIYPGPVEEVHPLSDGAILVIHHDRVSRYRLGGHLALIK
jgi:hypothetical protein